MSAPQRLLEVVVKPGAKAPGIVWDAAAGVVIVRVRERAVEGRANEAVREALAAGLGLSKSAVTLVRGSTSRRKAFAIAGLTATASLARLSAGQRR